MTDKNPKIRFGLEWIPAHEAWKKIETVNTVTDAIDSFNEKFPKLATQDTLQVVPRVRKRMRAIEVVMPPKEESVVDHVTEARDLLQTLNPEEAVEELKRRHDQDFSLRQLISLVGEEDYGNALRREAREYELNGILPEQTAQIWNEVQRPVPGGGLWNDRKIRDLLA